ALSPLALPDLPEEIGRRLVEEHLLDPEQFWLPVPPPSVAANELRFSRHDHFLFLRRYWRGPTWINAAWLLWLGLVRLGYSEAAAEMATRVGGAVATAGLREYYDPFTGRGMGAADFSWSALAMELIDPDPGASRATSRSRWRTNVSASEAARAPVARADRAMTAHACRHPGAVSLVAHDGLENHARSRIPGGAAGVCAGGGRP